MQQRVFFPKFEIEGAHHQISEQSPHPPKKNNQQKQTKQHKTKQYTKTKNTPTQLAKPLYLPRQVDGGGVGRGMLTSKLLHCGLGLEIEVKEEG